jgi:pheromone shutdown-related protein TraB
MPNVLIVGTSHIARQSVKEVKTAFEEFKPDIVAVELDQSRLQGLLSEKKGSPPLSLIRQVGLGGYLFALIGGALQKKLGDIVGMRPGVDMLTALRLAHENGKPGALIDRDILITLQRLSKAFTWKVKGRIFWDILRSPFSKRMRIDLSKVPEKELITRLMGELRQRYPELYRVLVEERNRIMAKNITGIAKMHPEARILVVVGAGHVEGMRELLEKSADPEKNTGGAGKNTAA